MENVGRRPEGQVRMLRSGRDGRVAGPGALSRRLALAWLGGALAAACDRRDRGAGAVTFSISLAEDEKAAVRDALHDFETASGLRVVTVAVTASDLPEKLRVEVGAGRASIDLFAQDNLAIRSLVDGQLVERLDDVAPPPEVLRALAPPELDGHRYFLPFRPNVQLTYANAARFREAGVALPRTAAELPGVARALKAAGRGIPRVTLSLAEGAPAAVTISELVLGFGGNPLVLNDGGSVAAFDFLQRLWQEGLLAGESLLAKYDTEVDYLIGETAWLAPNWPFTSGILARQDLLERFHVYEGWRGPAREAHVVGGDVLGIPRGVPDRRREQAARLATFLMSRDAQARLVGGNAWPAIREDAYAQAPAAQHETFAAVRRALAHGWYRPAVPYWPDVSQAMNDAVRRLLQRGEPVRAVLDALHDGIARAAGRTGSPYPPPA
jgi:trehalose transport system substrate-binding protein